MSCSIKLKKDKLSKIINKLDFFVFRAMEQKGISFYKISQNAKTAESEEILDKVRRGEYTKEQLQDIVGRKNAQVLVTASKVFDQVKIGNEVYKIAQMVSVLETVKNSIIPSYINDYTENAKINEDNGDKGTADAEFVLISIFLTENSFNNSFAKASSSSGFLSVLFDLGTNEAELLADESFILLFI
jgi:hypothetical protein